MTTKRKPATSKTPKKSPAKKPGRREQYSRRKVIKALEDAAGVKYIAANLLGCGTSTLDRYIHAHDDVREAYEELRNNRVERIEQALFKQADNGNVTALMFLLRTLGKGMGYAEAKPQNIGTPLPDEAKRIMTEFKDGNITAKEAAISLEVMGLPLPETVRLLLTREPVEEPDATSGEYAAISSEEIAARAAARTEELAAQKAEFLPERREAVIEVKQRVGTGTSGPLREGVPDGEKN